MDEAKRIADEGCVEGTVVIAKVQTKGRGRGSRIWESPQGGLYLSVVLRPDISAAKAHHLVFLAGNAAARALAHASGDVIDIKWPNDLCYKGLKVGGLLCESTSIEGIVKFAILGIGINTNVEDLSQDLRGKAASIHRIAGKIIDNEHVTESILDELSARYVDFPGNFPELLEEWRGLTTTLNRSVILDGRPVRALDVDDEGFLLVEEGGRQKRVVSGTVEYP